ncbi:MAG: efflux transporter outer membrane subunit [Staphylococcus sp.]|nr:efflux transporter outer membrane subunit [Staphylococcus sp.]
MMTGNVLSVTAQESGQKLLRESLPERWTYTTDIQQTLPSDDQWWKNFNDPLLDSLIEEGINNNFNVLTAISRMNMAKAAIGQASSTYYPTIGISGGYTKARNSGAIRGSDIPATNSSYFSFGADMSWEIDLFGKIRESVKNKKSLYNASRADYLATMVSLSADIAKYYFNLRTFQAQRFATNEHLESQQKVVAITQARFDAGLVSKLDVAQAKTVYYSTKASLPSLDASIKQAINAIAVLVGIYPEKLMERLQIQTPLPEYHQLIPAGIPANLLRRRPDIVAAEYEVAAYAAAIGMAKKEFLPNLSIHGSIGVSAHNGGDLFKKNSLEYSVAPTLSWTLFDGFSRKHTLNQAREQMKAGIENYNLTVMTAVQEVNNAMISYRSSLESIDSYTNVIKQCDESFNLSVDLYKEGLTSFTNVVDAQINSWTYATSLISAKGSALVDLVDIYKALGGSPVE